MLVSCAVLTVAGLLATGCSSSTDGGAVTVTLESTIGGSAAVTVAPMTSQNSASRSVTPPSGTDARTSGSETSASSSSRRTTTSTTADTASTPATTTTPTSGSAVTGPTTTGAGGVIQQIANTKAAGPDNGPSCSVAKQYSNEAPTGLRTDVIAAWKSLVKTAKAQDVTLCLNDGKRSAAQQTKLFTDYVKQFGEAMAKFYVLPPDKSAHVAGYAIDVQPANAYTWLQGTKGKYGFCRIYTNEAWHFEYAVAYEKQGCPKLAAEPRG